VPRELILRTVAMPARTRPRTAYSEAIEAPPPVTTKKVLPAWPDASELDLLIATVPTR